MQEFISEGGKTMYIIFLIVLLIPFIVLIVQTVLGKKTENTVVSEKTQCKGFIQSIAFLWSVTFGIFIMCLIGNISLEDIGFRQISFKYNVWFTTVTLALSGLALAYFLFQLVASLVSSKYREKLLADSHQGSIGALPRTKKEK